MLISLNLVQDALQLLSIGKANFRNIFIDSRKVPSNKNKFTPDGVTRLWKTLSNRIKSRRKPKPIYTLLAVSTILFVFCTFSHSGEFLCDRRIIPGRRKSLNFIFDAVEIPLFGGGVCRFCGANQKGVRLNDRLGRSNAHPLISTLE